MGLAFGMNLIVFALAILPKISITDKALLGLGIITAVVGLAIVIEGALKRE